MTRSRWIVPLTAASLMLAASVRASAMTIEEAYLAIPHQRPIFHVGIVKMPNEEATYLTQLFRLIDLAVRERVQALAWLAAHDAGDTYTDNYDVLLPQLENVHVPPRLQSVHRLVVEAVGEQRDVLRSWKQSPAMRQHVLAMQHPLIQSSSQKLHRAYNEVVQLFPSEDARNRQAFFDYFCCLDFL